MGSEKDLKKATYNWKLPLVARPYKSDGKGRKLMEEEAKILHKHGYEVGGQSTEAGQTNKGRTAVRAAVVGGLTAGTGGLGGFLFRPSKGKDQVVITYTCKSQ